MFCAHHFLKRLGVAVLVSACALTPVSAFADGPIDAGGVPGGAVAKTADNDALTGSTAGEQWGRAGGRNLAFTVGNTSDLATLYWGIVNATVPTVAFDNSLTPNTSEYMAFDGSGSNLAGGIARWSGSAQLQLVNAPLQAFATRFTLTVTTPNGAPIALSGVNGSVSPGINVLTSGSFRANLLFEMFANGSWGPLLTVYDALPTLPGPGPGTPGPVLSGVSTGFYFTGAGLTLADHDAHITGLLGAIKGDTQFLKDDTVGRLSGIMTDLSDVKNEVQQNIPSSLQQILGALQNQTQNPNVATRNDVNNAASQLQQMLAMLWGLMPCPTTGDPQSVQMCAMARKIQELSTQSSVDAVAILIGLLTGKVDTAQGSINGLGLKIDGVLGNVNGVGGKVDSVQTAINGMQLKLDAIAASTGATCADLASLDVQLAPMDSKGKSQHWLVRTTRDSVTVNPTVNKVLLIRNNKAVTTATDITAVATITTFATGLHDVALNNVKNAGDANALVVEVSQTIGSCTLNGSAMATNPASHDD